MSRRHPIRQPRGPRATLPKPTPLLDCETFPGDHGRDLCACWHQYDECPCDLTVHQAPHLAAGCPCPQEEA